MDLENEEKLIFEFFESRPDLKSKFYDSLHYIVFDGDNTKFKNLIISYYSQIVEFDNTRDKKGKISEISEKPTKKQKI